MCAQGCAGRGMKYYNTSLGNCAAPSSGVYQVSNTLIRKPPLPHHFPSTAGELRDFFPILPLFPAIPHRRTRDSAVSRGEDFLVRRREKLPGCLRKEKIDEERKSTLLSFFSFSFPSRNFVKYIYRFIL